MTQCVRHSATGDFVNRSGLLIGPDVCVLLHRLVANSCLNLLTDRLMVLGVESLRGWIKATGDRFRPALRRLPGPTCPTARSDSLPMTADLSTFLNLRAMMTCPEVLVPTGQSILETPGLALT